MNAGPTLGMYIPGNSAVHRAHPRTKLLALVALGVTVSFARSPAVLAGAVLIELGVIRAVKIPVQATARQLRGLAPLLAAILVAHALTSGWKSGVVVDLRLVALVLAANLVTQTTRTSAMLAQIQSAARPLRHLGVDPARVALTIALAVRFVPRLADLGRQVREAQRARGAERSLLAAFVPLLIKTLELADRTAEALEARGVD